MLIWFRLFSVALVMCLDPFGLFEPLLHSLGYVKSIIEAIYVQAYSAGTLWKPPLCKTSFSLVFNEYVALKHSIESLTLSFCFYQISLEKHQTSIFNTGSNNKVT